MKVVWMREGTVELDDEQMKLAAAWGWTADGDSDAERLLDVLGIKLDDHVTFDRFELEP